MHEYMNIYHCICKFHHLETVIEESVVEKSMRDDKLDHDDEEVEELTEYETTKVDIVSEKNILI